MESTPPAGHHRTDPQTEAGLNAIERKAGRPGGPWWEPDVPTAWEPDPNREGWFRPVEEQS